MIEEEYRICPIDGLYCPYLPKYDCEVCIEEQELWRRKWIEWFEKNEG